MNAVWNSLARMAMRALRRWRGKLGRRRPAEALRGPDWAVHVVQGEAPGRACAAALRRHLPRGACAVAVVADGASGVSLVSVEKRD